MRPEHDSRWLEDELDFTRHLRIFTRHKLLLFSGALLGALVGLAISMTRPARYEAVTTLIAHLPPRPGTGGVDRATLRAFIENQTLAGQVIEGVGLNQAPHHLTPQRFAAEALRVEEIAGTNLFRVRVQLGDPALATEASRRLAREAVALNKRVAGDAGGVLRNELKPHLAEAAERLTTAEQQLVSYQREAQIELLRADSNALLDERGELFRLLLDIESERARLKTAEGELRGRKAVLSAERLPNAEEALRRAASLEAEEFQQRQPTSPLETSPRKNGRADDRSRADGTVAGRRPDVPAGSGQRQAGTAQAEPPLPRPGERGTVDPNALDLSDPLVNPVYQTLEFQLATSRARLAALESHRAELMRKAGGPKLKELTSLYERHVELARRQNEYELAEEVFHDVSLRYEKASTDLVGSSAYLQIIDEAVHPDRPMPRKRVQTIMLGLLCGLIAAAGLAVARDSAAGGGPSAA